MERPIRVFVSYSHESSEHSAAVLALADRLRRDGVDAWIDRYVEAPPEGWPRWIQRRFETSDYVLCVCTPTYRRAFEGTNDPQLGLGVNYEGFLILQDLYDTGNTSDRYVPITLGPTDRRLIPSQLRAFSHYDAHRDYDNLVRRLVPGEPVRHPVEPVPTRNERGYESQARTSVYLRPEDQPLPKLAPSDGLFLSRVINQLDPYDPTVVMTVWLAARGGDQFIVDSARIYNEWVGGAGSTAGVAIAPDAEYRFSFRDVSDEVHPLHPALSLGPDTRRTAWFTMTAAPDEALRGFARLWIWVRYHTAAGRRGVLVLNDPPDYARELAGAVRRDVFIIIDAGGREVEMLVSPEGLQRGLDESQDHEFRLRLHDLGACVFHTDVFRPLPDVSIALGDLAARTAREQSRREALNSALAAAGIYPMLAQRLTAGHEWAADVLGTLADPASTRLLLERLHEKPADAVAFHGLCIRHFICRDDVLPTAVIDQAASDASLPWPLSKKLVGTLVAAPFAVSDGEVNAARNRSWFAAMECLLADCSDLDWPAVALLTQGRVPPPAWREIVDHVGGPLGSALYIRGSMDGWQQFPVRVGTARVGRRGGLQRHDGAVPCGVHVQDR